MSNRVVPRRGNHMCKSTEGWENEFGSLVHSAGSLDLSNVQLFHGRGKVSTLKSGETDFIIMPDTALTEITM